MKNYTVGLDESELNARGDHIRPSNRQRSSKRESPDFSCGSVIKKYSIQLLDENTLAIETGVSAKDILLIEEYKKEIMNALKARQKAEQASASEFQNKIDAIPGLKEVESALEDMATWSYIRRDKTPPEYDLQSMQVKYPRAFAYLKSREYERSANRMKAQAGRDAVVKIVNGEDYQAVIAEMEELVAEHIM